MTEIGVDNGGVIGIQSGVEQIIKAGNREFCNGLCA